MGLNTFEILQEIRALEDLLNEVDPESGEFLHSKDVIKDYIINLQTSKENKLNNIEDLKLELKAQSEALKQKEEKLYAKRKSIDSNIERLKDLQVMLLQGEKLKTDEYTFSFRNSQSVDIYDINMLEDKFFKIEKKPILKDIAEAIKKANSKGESFFGAEIKDKISLSVRWN